MGLGIFELIIIQAVRDNKKKTKNPKEKPKDMCLNPHPLYPDPRPYSTDASHKKIMIKNGGINLRIHTRRDRRTRRVGFFDDRGGGNELLWWMDGDLS